jgi:ABC-type amino acid transport substrate-binding protein
MMTHPLAGRRKALAQLAALWPLASSCPLKCLAAATPGRLRIGTMELPPYGWIDEQGRRRGAYFELGEMIGTRAGLPYENEIMPFGRMLQSLKDGRVDLASSQAHQQALDAGEPLAVIHTINVVAATRKGSGIRTLGDLKGKTIVLHRGASYKQLDGLPGSVEVVDSYEQALRMVHARAGIDAAVFSEPAYWYLLQKLGLRSDDFGRLLTLEVNKEQWIFVRHGLDESLKSRLRSVVDQLREQAAFEKIIRAFGTPGPDGGQGRATT